MYVPKLWFSASIPSIFFLCGCGFWLNMRYAVQMWKICNENTHAHGINMNFYWCVFAFMLWKLWQATWRKICVLQRMRKNFCLHFFSRTFFSLIARFSLTLIHSGVVLCVCVCVFQQKPTHESYKTTTNLNTYKCEMYIASSIGK